ncbi:MAG TPA: hypothetical protein VM327_04330 [Candidatus Thermoplasmatota archaeon]|nr:hypothetical protein [Candidatus Thermoplasmatota archaeon]
MARDVSLDLEASSPAAGLLRPPPATASPIAQERVGPGRPPVAFVLGAVALGALVVAVALGLGQGEAGTPAERQAASSVAGVAGLGFGAGRALAAVAAGIAVAGVAMAGRRLTHSSLAGLLAAALVAADPAVLLQARLALPASLALAGLSWALAFTTSPVPLFHWFAGFALAVATFFDPWAALWTVPLVAILLLRGHIYAAPQHLALGLVQMGLLPAIAVGSRWLLDGELALVPACLMAMGFDRLVLATLPQPGPGLLLVPNPVVWLGGAGALFIVGLVGLAFSVGRFRVARAPGRLQVRIVSPMPPVLARSLWLLVLAILAPPVIWPVLFAIALAMGIRELGEDAPGFGLALAVVLLVFAGLVLVRAWGAIAGGDGGLGEALRLVPWARAQAC